MLSNITGCRPVYRSVADCSGNLHVRNPAIPLVVLGYVFSISGVAWWRETGTLLRRASRLRTGWDLVDGILTVVAGLILLTASVGG